MTIQFINVTSLYYINSLLLMKQDFSHLKVLAISIHNIEKCIYYSEGSFYFETMEAHLTEGMLKPKLVSSKHSFDAFECAFIQFCRFYPVFNYHLTYIHEDYKNELKSLIPNQSENAKSISSISRSWLFITI